MLIYFKYEQKYMSKVSSLNFFPDPIFAVRFCIQEKVESSINNFKVIHTLRSGDDRRKILCVSPSGHKLISINKNADGGQLICLKKYTFWIVDFLISGADPSPFGLFPLFVTFFFNASLKIFLKVQWYSF